MFAEALKAACSIVLQEKQVIVCIVNEQLTFMLSPDFIVPAKL